ncbi:MAG: diphthine--ammonia ligase [Dehalococcoidales bacterium]|nr:diphthine--ammonia ligase [Dehalococcoidales bacterium]
MKTETAGTAPQKVKQTVRAFASWSGGKDGCLALYRALKSGLQVSYLLNMLSEDGTRSASHGVPASVIARQAEALGIPIVQRAAGRGNYEEVFIRTVTELKAHGVNSGIFGDIDFNAHREWIENVCRKAGVTPHLPLWEESHRKLMEELIDAGFEPIVVAAKTSFFGKETVGKTVDRSFLSQLEARGDVTLCGEAGEYHTLVIDGPIFRKRLEVTEARVVTRNEHHFLEIEGVRLSPSKKARTA